MRIKISIIILVVFIVGVIAIFVRMNGGRSGYTTSPTSTTTPQTTPTTPVAGTPVKSYTLAQIAPHKDASSCWTSINGKVYDVTTWIDQHPGGRDAILSICGKDGSSAFNNQHGGQERPADELKNFYIGELAK